jgi:hypothetical protein
MSVHCTPHPAAAAQITHHEPVHVRRSCEHVAICGPVHVCFDINRDDILVAGFSAAAAAAADRGQDVRGNSGADHRANAAHLGERGEETPIVQIRIRHRLRKGSRRGEHDTV